MFSSMMTKEQHISYRTNSAEEDWFSVEALIELYN
jgi:hypothetical protein